MHIRHILPQSAMGYLPDDPGSAALTGISNVAWSLAQQQLAAGHCVELVAPGGGRGLRTAVVDGVTLRWLPEAAWLRNARFDFSYLLPLQIFGMVAGITDIAHVHSNPFFLRTTRAAAHVLHYHNSPPGGSPRYTSAVHRAHTVICCSCFIREQFLDRVLFPAERVRVVYNGADIDQFSIVDRTAARVAYGIERDRVVLLYVGRIGYEKGLHVLLDALERVIATCDKPPLLLVAGSGRLGFEGYRPAWADLQSYEAQVRHQASQLPVMFLGNVSRSSLPKLYRAADLFVCPSVYEEPFGMVNIEAAAAGLPVVGSCIGGIPEAIIPEGNGLLVAPADVAALATALAQLIHNPELRRTYARESVRLAAHYSWNALADEVLGLYNAALKPVSRPIIAG
ncbi:MAG: glycosyltransferase family 4 protein [Chloroflexales bacterium]|nr:glycosyltransferase family 4 protein [Chloroflexales bacterium]